MFFGEAVGPRRRRRSDRPGVAAPENPCGPGRAKAPIPMAVRAASAPNVVAFSRSGRGSVRGGSARLSAAKRDAVLASLRLLVRDLPATTPVGPNGGYYTQARVLDEVLRAAGASEDERERAKSAYDLLLTLRPQGAEPRRPARYLLCRSDLAALRAYDRYAGRGEHRSRANDGARILLETLEAVLVLADRKAPLDLQGRPLWMQAVTVAAADNALLSPDQCAAVLEKGSAVSGALIASHEDAKRFLLLPRRGDAEARG